MSSTDSALSGNSAPYAGDAIYNDNAGTVRISGSIIANSGGGNGSGFTAEMGYNLTNSNGDCGLNAMTDRLSPSTCCWPRTWSRSWSTSSGLA